jgi:hypothetical protein
VGWAPSPASACSRRTLYSDYSHLQKYRINPQPPIVLRPPHQFSSHWILPNVFRLFLQALTRPQHMIKRFLFPHRAAAAEPFIDAVRRSAFHALQNIHQGNRPSIGIAKRLQQQMHVIWHDHNRVETNSWRRCRAGAPARGLQTAFPETVFEHHLPCRVRQLPTCRTKSNKQIRIRLLQMRKPSSITILR